MRLPSGDAAGLLTRPIAHKASGVIRSLFSVMLFLPIIVCAFICDMPIINAATTSTIALFIRFI